MGKANHIITGVFAVLGVLLLSGCIEESTVIKINRDGSGIIHERSYSANPDSVISFPGSKDGDAEEADEEKPKLPAEAALREYAATLGEGVRFQSVKASTNKKGWKGYEIIFAFDDINTVRYTKATPKPNGSDDDGANEEEKKGDDEKNEFTATFAMKNGELSIRMEREGLDKKEKAPQPAADSPTIDPFADTEGPDPVKIDISSTMMNEQMLKAMTKGMRMGIFVEIDGEIAKSNALHRNGKLITLFNADLGTMFENEGGMAAMEGLEKADRAQFQEMADGLEGLDIDLQDPIVVSLR